MIRWRLPLVNDNLARCKTTTVLMVWERAEAAVPTYDRLYADHNHRVVTKMCSFTAGSQQTMSVHGICGCDVGARALRRDSPRLQVPHGPGWGQTTRR